MKKLFLAVAILCPVLLSAQNFEGVIKYGWTCSDSKVASMMPTTSIITIKGTNAKVVMEGGMMASMMGEMISIGSEKATYFLIASEKTAYKVKTDEVNTKKNDDAVVTKENSTAVILGYKCQKYKVVTKSSTIYVWATTEIDLSNVDYKGKLGYKGVEGMIMKHEMNVVDNGKTYVMTMTMTAYEKKTISDSVFKIPSDYTVKEEMPGMMKFQKDQ